jgi:hypothetical protein
MEVSMDVKPTNTRENRIGLQIFIDTLRKYITIFLIMLSNQEAKWMREFKVSKIQTAEWSQK